MRHFAPSGLKYVTSAEVVQEAVVRLRIESIGGSPVNEYRIRGDAVEFRVLDPKGRPYGNAGSEWRAVDDCDIQLHHALGTVVSKWLDVRRGAEDTVLDKAA